jgi:hypothetical protein
MDAAQRFASATPRLRSDQVSPRARCCMRRWPERIEKLCSTLSPDVAVPACPGWTIGELMAHSAGEAAQKVKRIPIGM